MDFSILDSVLIVLTCALIASVIFRYLNLPVILGYLLVGAIVGPHALKLISGTRSLHELAEFGIVFLMFSIGLEFSLGRLFALKYTVFFLGGLQVLITMLVTILVGNLFGIPFINTLVIGGILAMSSTAIVTKQLSEQQELHNKHGLDAMSILLFQDLAVIPLIILIASLPGSSHQSLLKIMYWSFAKSLFAILLILILGRVLLKPLFRIIAATRTIELFTLAVLLVTLLAAWTTHILNLTYTLGAFLAGMMLSETQFKRQIEVEIRPFRDVLLGLFFITIGMLLNLSIWLEQWFLILCLTVALILGKTLLVFVLSYSTRRNARLALSTGIILAQGGEFGFAILTLAILKGALPMEYEQIVLSALILSIIIAPFLIRFNQQLVHSIFKSKEKIPSPQSPSNVRQQLRYLKQHILICGYGRVGQNLTRFLEKCKLPYVGIDMDAELVANLNLAGQPVIYGDATHPEILRMVNLSQARAVVANFEDVHKNLKVVQTVKQQNKNVVILARCRDKNDFIQLKAAGATEVIADVFEESITLAYHLLNLIKIPAHHISHLMEEVRNKDYDLLRKVFPSAEENEYFIEQSLYEHLRPIFITDQAYAVDKKLAQLNLADFNVEVMAIRRDGSKPLAPHGNMHLQAGDIIILYGLEINLDEAEKKLLEG